MNELVTARHFARQNLLPGEDPAMYERMRAELIERYAPQSLLDHSELQFLLDTLWELMRLFRLKPQILNIDRKRALAQLIQSVLMSPTILSAHDIEESSRLASAYFNDDDERLRIDMLLSRYGITADSIMARSFADNSTALEAIEQQIQLATARAYAMQAQMENIAARNGRHPKRKLRIKKQIAR